MREIISAANLNDLNQQVLNFTNIVTPPYGELN